MFICFIGVIVIGKWSVTSIFKNAVLNWQSTMQFFMTWSIAVAEFFPTSVGLFIVGIMLYRYIVHNIEITCKNNIFHVFNVFRKQIFTKLLADFYVSIRRPVDDINIVFLVFLLHISIDRDSIASQFIEISFHTF